MVRVWIANSMCRQTFDSVTPDTIPISSSDGGLPSAVRWSHLVIEGRLAPGQVAVDATAGNGHDSLFLARNVGPGGRVFIFDVQAAALEATSERLGHAGVSDSSYRLLNCGHETLACSLPADLKGGIQVIMFNLGYLPGSDKRVITETEKTLRGIKSALDWLAFGGLVTVVVYPGHPGGAEEARAVSALADRLPPRAFEVQHIRPINCSSSPPELWVFLKRNRGQADGACGSLTPTP